MTTQETNYASAIATGADAVATAVEAQPGRQVPSCPGWELAELARHMGSLYVRVAGKIRGRSPDPARSPDLPPAAGELDLAGWLRQTAEGLLEALANADDDAPAGRWRDRNVTTRFWWRRMAHETAIHQIDAADALGKAVTLPGDLANDGVDEALELFLPFSTTKDRWPPGGALWLARADGPEQWWIEPGEDGVHVARRPLDGLAADRWPSGDTARVEAPAAELFLVCWGRRVPPATGVTGSFALLESWLSVFGW